VPPEVKQLYIIDILFYRYIKELDNNVADAFYRIETIGKSIDHQTLAAAQVNDAELRDIVNSGTSALRLKKHVFLITT
jgi:hypothetical protein